MIPFSGCRSRTTPYDNILVHPALLSRLCDTQTIREIGAAYRSERPDESQEDKLKDLLLADSSGNAGLGTMDSLGMTQLLERNVRQDFASGKTIQIKGWVLSTTEARQCALYSLSHH
jgi:hypothetical protein